MPPPPEPHAVPRPPRRGQELPREVPEHRRPSSEGLVPAKPRVYGSTVVSTSKDIPPQDGDDAGEEEDSDEEDKD